VFAGRWYVGIALASEYSGRQRVAALAADAASGLLLIPRANVDQSREVDHSRRGARRGLNTTGDQIMTRAGNGGLYARDAE